MLWGLDKKQTPQRSSTRTDSLFQNYYDDEYYYYFYGWYLKKKRTTRQNLGISHVISCGVDPTEEKIMFAVECTCHGIECIVRQSVS